MGILTPNGVDQGPLVGTSGPILISGAHAVLARQNAPIQRLCLIFGPGTPALGPWEEQFFILPEFQFGTGFLLAPAGVIQFVWLDDKAEYRRRELSRTGE